MITITSDGIDLTLLFDPKASIKKIEEIGGMLTYELQELNNYNFRPSGYTVSSFYDEDIFKARQRFLAGEYKKWIKNPLQILSSLEDTLSFGCRKGRPLKFVDPYLIKKYYRFGLIQACTLEVIDFIYRRLMFQPVSNESGNGGSQGYDSLDFWGYSGF